MKDFTFNVPQDIIFGKGSLKRLPELLEKSGSKKMLLISGPVLKKIGMVEKVEEIVKASGIEVEVFTDVEANPSVATVDKATEAYKKAGATSIVAFGGGSPMDVAKAVGVLAKYGGEIGDYEGAHKVPGPIVPIIAIPFERRTLAIFLRAEFGFFGVAVLTAVHTPLFCGADVSVALFFKELYPFWRAGAVDFFTAV